MNIFSLIRITRLKKNIEECINTLSFLSLPLSFSLLLNISSKKPHFFSFFHSLYFISVNENEGGRGFQRISLSLSLSNTHRLAPISFSFSLSPSLPLFLSLCLLLSVFSFLARFLCLSIPYLTQSIAVQRTSPGTRCRTRYTP